MKLAHIIAVRSLPIQEVRETMCPVADVAARVASLQRSWETVFVYRVFHATDRA